MTGSNYPEYDHAFFRDGYRLGEQAVGEIREEEKLFSAIKTMYDSVDQLIESLLAMGKKQQVTVDCRKGCSWCCHQPVFANTYELRYLAAFVKNNLRKTEQKQVYQLAVEKNDRTGKLAEKEILNHKHPCPLLKDGSCTAYAARPLACRIYLSMNVESCYQFYRYPGKTDCYPALLDFPLRAGRMMNEGFFAALKENGIFSHELRLEEGLVNFLGDPSL
ncbi:MAG: YkgJ family cysteine cluster protein [Mangrovibacterium sp.]|nr:YkgJ family cysteine cluster protein [Mangrovibacterium sp.]